MIILSNSSPENDRAAITEHGNTFPVTFSEVSGSLFDGFSLLCDNPPLSNPQNPAEAACPQQVLICRIAVCGSARVCPKHKGKERCRFLQFTSTHGQIDDKYDIVKKRPVDPAEEVVILLFCQVVGNLPSQASLADTLPQCKRKQIP